MIPRNQPEPPPELEELRRRCKELAGRVYELQQHYASEHFALQEAMHDLQTERLRNAGLHGQVKTTLERAQSLQTRIDELKTRLRAYEPVVDEFFDAEPIVIEGFGAGESS